VSDLHSTITRESTHLLLCQRLPASLVNWLRLAALLLLLKACLQFEKDGGGRQAMETFVANALDGESDVMLVAATKRGDTLAFEKLVLRYKPRIFAVAKRITKNREDAEDVVQESFHKAFRHLSDFQERARFSTWMTRIAMNEAFMLLRRRRGNSEVLPDSPDDSIEFFPAKFIDQRPSPEEACCLRERKEILAKAINRLGAEMRKTVLLRDIEERSTEETAQILGASIGVVKSRLLRGRRKLRTSVNPRLLWEVHAPGHAEALLF
jgi:RNA polymerase sigma-70 factor (ECF subfamily)